MHAEKPAIIILFAGRLPGEKAAAIFVDLESESFAKAGLETLLLAPRRLGRDPLPQRPYKIVYLPTLDLTRIPIFGRIAGYVNVLAFSLSALLWMIIWGERTARVLSNEALPLFLASLYVRHTIYEAHDFPEGSLWLYRALFRRIEWILATNEWKAGELSRQFDIPRNKIIVERNAVDTDLFTIGARDVARRALRIAQEARVVVYTGNLYEWKGAGTLAQTARMLPDILFYFIGGTPDDVRHFAAEWKHLANIHVVGHVPYTDVPLWQTAADVLVLPNSGKTKISAQYTSPMKLFEYMASGRPIVASDVPSIREVAGEDLIFFAKADDPSSFASAITAALCASNIQERTQRMREVAEYHSWKKRAERLLSIFVQ